MPLPINWTGELDRQLTRLRHLGATWDAIGGMLGISRNSVLTRGGHLGLCRSGGSAPKRRVAIDPMPRKPRCPAKVEEGSLDIDPLASGRPPLPPGDPIAWSVLTDGTLLHGAGYPVITLEGSARGEGWFSLDLGHADDVAAERSL